MKPLVCIFAHPDDESFGPGGTIATFAKTRDVYIICVTSGQVGQKPKSVKKDLGEVRKQELLKSAEILGIKQVFFLDYVDGELCNNVYHEIAEKISKILQKIKPDTLLTFEQRGVSGHLDHIAVSMISSYIFEKLEFVKKIMYYCNIIQQRKLIKNYFIYFPAGYKKSEVQETVDTTVVWDTKVKAMMVHESQKEDCERVLSRQRTLPKEEYFLVRIK